MGKLEFIRNLQSQLEQACRAEERAKSDARDAMELHQRLLEKRQVLETLIKNYR